MKILKQSTNSQTLKIIPRSYPAIVDMIIRNEDTRISTQLNGLVTSTSNGYLEITTIFDLIEDTFYSVEVLESSDIIYKCKIFCTNQTNYSINNGEYIEHEKNNKYVIYGT